MKKVAVTGGAGQIAYSLLFRIASGEMLGSNQEVELRILEVPAAMEALRGVVMELKDCAFPLLKSIKISSDPYEIFEGVDYALLVGASPRGPGMERGDLLLANAEIFISQGKALSEKAKKEALVLVVGNPCNTNALITMHLAKNLNPRRIYSMTRLDENRAKSQLAEKADCLVKEVTNMVVWGNHSATQVPDFSHAKIGGKPAFEVITDEAWLRGAFIETVQKRGAEIIAARGKSSAASAANAALDSIRSLLTPTPEGDWFSLGILSDGNPYGIADGLIFSFPCRSRGDGNVEIVPGLHIDPFLKEMLKKTEEELISERAAIKERLPS